MKIATLFILLFAASIPAQKSSAPAYKIRAKDGGLRVTFQGKPHWLDVREHIDAAEITETALLFATEKDGFRYLVADVSGSSRERRNDRQCGAGIESNLIWVKLDAAWKIVDARSVRYQSCWSGTDLNDPFKTTETTLALSFDNIRDKLSVRVFYSSKEPEKGLHVEETKLKDY